MRLAVKRREYVALEAVRECWTAQAAKAKDMLRHKFELELPPVLSGLDAMAIQAECARGRSMRRSRSCTSRGGGVG